MEVRIDPEDWGRAIADVAGPQIVVAGPGTGKTEFLVRRAVALTADHGVATDRLAMLTFSRRGASDLRRRFLDRLASSTTDVPASTFHSLAYRLLERYAEGRFGWQDMPSLLTGPEHVLSLIHI